MWRVFNTRFLGSKETKHAHHIQNYRGRGGGFLLHYSNALLSILGCWIPFGDTCWWQYLHIGLMLGKSLHCFLRCLKGGTLTTGISSHLPQAITEGGLEWKSTVDLFRKHGELCGSQHPHVQQRASGPLHFTQKCAKPSGKKNPVPKMLAGQVCCHVVVPGPPGRAHSAGGWGVPSSPGPREDPPLQSRISCTQ